MKNLQYIKLYLAYDYLNHAFFNDLHADIKLNKLYQLANVIYEKAPVTITTLLIKDIVNNDNIGGKKEFLLKYINYPVNPNKELALAICDLTKQGVWNKDLDEMNRQVSDNLLRFIKNPISVEQMVDFFKRNCNQVNLTDQDREVGFDEQTAQSVIEAFTFFNQKKRSISFERKVESIYLDMLLNNRYAHRTVDKMLELKNNKKIGSGQLQNLLDVIADCSELKFKQYSSYNELKDNLFIPIKKQGYSRPYMEIIMNEDAFEMFLAIRSFVKLKNNRIDGKIALKYGLIKYVEDNKADPTKVEAINKLIALGFVLTDDKDRRFFVKAMDLNDRQVDIVLKNFGLYINFDEINKKYITIKKSGGLTLHQGDSHSL